MANEQFSLLGPGIVVAGTYLLHSTVWLLAAGCVTATAGRRSPLLGEGVWRWAALLSFVTAACQFLAGPLHPTWTWTIPPVDGAATTVAAVPQVTPLIEPIREHHPSAGAPARLADVRPSAGLEAIVAVPSKWLTTEPVTAPHTDPIDDAIPKVDSLVSEHAGSEHAKPAVASRVVHSPSPFDTQTSSSNAQYAAASARARTLWMVVLAVGILVWVVVGLLRVAGLAWLTQVRIRRSPLLTDGRAVAILEDLRALQRVNRSVRIVLCNRGAEPAALGLSRWTIALPRGLEDELDAPQLRALLAHELAHLVRGDVRWLWIGRLLTAAFGWQPLNHLAVRRWREASEQLCDDWAVAGGVEPLTLAKCLAGIAERRLNGSAPVVGLTVIGRRSGLARRVERLAGPRHRDRWSSPTGRRLLTVGLLTAAGVMIWSFPVIVWANPDTDVAANNAVLGIDSSESVSKSLPPPTVPEPVHADALDVLHVTEAVPRDDPVTGELSALYRDLSHALELLANTDPDPEIATLADRIRERIQGLELKHSGPIHTPFLEDSP